MQAVPAGTTSGGPSGNINYFLTNSTTQDQTDTSLIDPNLEATMSMATEQVNGLGVQPVVKVTVEVGKGQKEQEDSMAESESRLARTLRNFNEFEA